VGIEASGPSDPVFEVSVSVRETDRAWTFEAPFTSKESRRGREELAAAATISTTGIGSLDDGLID
jgi:hypothetical protein